MPGLLTNGKYEVRRGVILDSQDMHKERFEVFAVLSTLAGAVLKTSKGTRYRNLFDMKCYYLIL